MSKEKVNYTESLVHRTKYNPCPKYSDFDKLFYKFPSYLRRDAISNGKRFKKQLPRLQLKHFKCPTLFKGNMFERISDNEVKIKIFHKNDWVWFNCNLRQQDVKYILSRVKTITDIKKLSPILCSDNRKCYLKFSFKKKVFLSKTKLKEQIIVSVDLGMNNTAVCSADGCKRNCPW